MWGQHRKKQLISLGIHSSLHPVFVDVLVSLTSCFGDFTTMKKTTLFTIILIALLLTVSARHGSPSSSEVKQSDTVKNPYRVQVPFIENKGNIEDKEVWFFASTFGGRGTVYVGKNGIITYNFPFKDQQQVVIKELFTEKNVTVTPLEPPSPLVIEMFKKRMDIKEDISNYYRISWGEIYKGITLEITAFADAVEKLIIVSPGGDPEKIKISLKGTKELKIDGSGNLELITALGSGKFNKPFAFQELGDEQRKIEVAYFIDKNNVYGFKLGKYDNKKPLIIRF